MNNKTIIFIVCLCIGCTSNKEVKYYPNEIEFGSSKLIDIVNRGSLASFKSVTDDVARIISEDSIPYLEIENNKEIKKIKLNHYKGGYYSERNRMRISEDSIKVVKKYSLEELPKILEKHYLNNGESPYLAKDYSMAFVEISLDTNSNFKKLMKTINSLTNYFDEINLKHGDSLELNIFLNYLRDLPEPPKPPNN